LIASMLVTVLFRCSPGAEIGSHMEY
jgi:hypothetical protein